MQWAKSRAVQQATIKTLLTRLRPTQKLFFLILEENRTELVRLPHFSINKKRFQHLWRMHRRRELSTPCIFYTVINDQIKLFVFLCSSWPAKPSSFKITQLDRTLPPTWWRARSDFLPLRWRLLAAWQGLGTERGADAVRKGLPPQKGSGRGPRLSRPHVACRERVLSFFMNINYVYPLPNS